MGIFSQDKTTTNQTAYNEQVGVSAGTTTGGFTTSGAGSVTAGSGAVLGSAGSATAGRDVFNRVGGNVIQNLDATALDTAASLVNNALNANTALAQQAVQSFQGSNNVSGEAQQANNGLAPPTDNGNPFNLPSIGGYQLHITDFLWVGVALVGVVLVIGYVRSRK